MFFNYATIAVRNLTRHKLYSLINIFGLAIGLSASMIALLFIQHELGYDTFHAKSDRIYRILRERGQADRRMVSWLTSGALARAIEADHPQVERASKSRLYTVTVRDGDRVHGLVQGHVDDQFFDLFDFPFVSGSESDLSRPYTAAITRRTADLFFPGQDPIGRTITIEERYYGGDYTITSILEDPPTNSSIQFDLIHKTEPVAQEGKLDWTTWQPRVQQANIQTFVLLGDGQDPEAFESQLPAFLERHMGEEARSVLTYRLQPLLDWHLYSAVDYRMAATGDINQVIAFAVVAGFVLLIACVNFTSLATARSVSRGREVGLRKVIGAYRHQIVQQFFGESLLLACLAGLLAVAIVRMTLPSFNTLAEMQLALTGATIASAAPAWLLLVAVVGVLAGLYPALYLSGFQPVEVFRKTVSRSAGFRKGLVVFQFALSIAMIVGTGMVQRQVAYLSEKNLGFEAEQLVILPIFRTDRESKKEGEQWLVGRYNVVKEAFKKHPDVLAASALRFLPGERQPMARLVKPEGHDDAEWRMPVQECDESFAETFGIPLLAGRTFNPDNQRDRTHGWMLNESAVKALGWTPQDAIGRRFGRARSEEDAKGEVIGVVGDYHYAPLRQKLGPAVMGFRPWFYDHLALRISGNNLSETIVHIEDTWRKFMRPDQPPTYRFMDERLARLYENERRLGLTVGVFTALAILLGCLGLFGLASFTTEQRVREIGVRKTLGASTGSILALLSSDFVKLVGFGCLVAWPAAYYFTQRWLEGFAYRTPIDPLVFLGAGLFAHLIALLTVSYQSVRAARTDPVHALRHE